MVLCLSRWVTFAALFAFFLHWCETPPPRTLILSRSTMMYDDTTTIFAFILKYEIPLFVFITFVRLGGSSWQEVERLIFFLANATALLLVVHSRALAIGMIRQARYGTPVVHDSLVSNRAGVKYFWARHWISFYWETTGEWDDRAARSNFARPRKPHSRTVM